MRSRGKISVALLLTYIFAMALNAFVVLTCDCASCHQHPVHSCKCSSCELLEQNPSFSQHCECTHSHENPTEVAVVADNERDLKLMRFVIAELPRTIVDTIDADLGYKESSPIVPQSLSLEDDPLISAGGLRAPPVFA